MKNQPKTGNETLDAEALILNTLNRNCDIVGMACFAPIVNTRGCIFTHPEGIVLRSTYHVFDLYVNYLGDEVLEAWAEDMETMQANAQDGRAETVEVLDVLGTRFTSDGTLAFAAVNKDPFEEKALVLHPGIDGAYCWRQITVWGESTESYNDIGHTEVELKEGEWREGNGSLSVNLKAHSVHVIQFRKN